MELMVNQDIIRWNRNTGRRVLSNLGIEPGNHVLDLGCREGRYAVIAAELVSRFGKVYAVDRDVESINRLKAICKQRNLTHLFPVCTDFFDKWPFGKCTMDVVLLFDVVHGVYFPRSRQREILFNRVYETLKPGGRLLLYPTHVRKHGPPASLLRSEINRSGLVEEDCARRVVLHDQKLVRGNTYCYLRPHK